MHAVVMESLEEFLAGSLEPVERRGIEAHLNGCAACREELQGMEDISLLFGALKFSELEVASDELSLEPAPGFYAQVMQRVAENQASSSSSWTSFFAFDPIWARRMVVSCLLLLSALGAYLVTSERHYASGPMPDAVMAQQTEPLFDSSPAPESMLVTLANYEH